MSEVKDQTHSAAPVAPVLEDAVHHILENSSEPLTATKIRALLPTSLRAVGLEELTGHLYRQASAKVLWQFPKYRSLQDRFWDRPMQVHIAVLLRDALKDGPLAWSELRRKLPAYVQSQAAGVLEDQINQRLLFRYPRRGRKRKRFGIQPPDPKLYLRSELTALFQRLACLGFQLDRLRACALELLHDEEWQLIPKPQSSSCSE